MKEGGGAAICIRDSLKFKRHLDLDKLYTDTFECIFIELTTKQKKTIVIGSLYRPPNTKPNKFISQYKKMIHNIQRDKHKEIVLGMDHNLNLLKTQIHKDTQEFMDMNFDNNLFPCII